MSTEATSERAEFVAALRELADFYERNPDMPLPKYPGILVGIWAETDEEGIPAVQAAADLLGVEMHPPGSPSPGQAHYRCTGRFGPGRDLYPSLELRVYYIPESARDGAE